MNWRRFSNPLPRAPQPKPRPAPRRPRRNPEAVGAIRTIRDMTPAKGQSVRLADVILIGPLMIWGGTEASKAAKTDLGKNAGNALAFMGVGTMFYNGINYARVKKGTFC